MKTKTLFILIACAVLFSAAPVCALTPGTCADWEGKWVFTYDNASRNDNVTITEICSKPTASSATPACMPTGSVHDSWLCVARGKRVSDNQSIQIRLIAMDTKNYGYYEGKDSEIDQYTTFDTFAADNFTKCAFTGAHTLNEATSGLLSGEKDNCTDNGTTPVEDNCTLEKIIPGKISKLGSIIQPIKPFVIIGSGDPAFEKGDRAAFDSVAIKPLIQLRISTKIIIAICIVRPFKLTSDAVDVSVGDCFGTITVK